MTKNDDKRVPVLRFKGFNDDWAQRLLKHFITVSSQKNLDNSFDKFDVLSVSGKYGIVNQIKFQGRSLAGKTLTNYKVVNTNDVVYTKSPIKNNPYGVIKVNKHKSGIVSTLYAVYNPTKYVCSNFVELYFNDNLRLNKYLKPIVNIGAKHDMKIANKEVINHNVIFPEVEEQRQICTLFLKLEKLISLQQRKLEQLKLVKKALLQDLFTSKEASILRFKGFSGKWEKHKLGDFGTVAMNKRIFKNQTTETGDIPFYKIGTFGKKADSFISRKLFEQYKKRYPYPQKGDLLISASGSIGRIIEYKGEAAYYQDSNIVWLNHNNKLLNSFLKAYYQIIHWDGIEGSTIKRLYNKNILLTKIYLPTLKEQQEIGVLFKVIDEEIDLQQKRISKLQTIKQFLLQNMFI